ncbi:hypothetical protein MILUP08_44974 [Micromonospora lupini str. Lupac 08]|uniref:Uncharacterized protein n=1 Tax=Micromonospora lupini str. Lupac 08 TaxID=1150864 RepID=I0L8E7_9ACTN|nr:hypothetical protein MILUP08_44974 [Micromonospora lupini str. Lupac 08]
MCGRGKLSYLGARVAEACFPRPHDRSKSPRAGHILRFVFSREYTHCGRPTDHPWRARAQPA